MWYFINTFSVKLWNFTNVYPNWIWYQRFLCKGNIRVFPKFYPIFMLSIWVVNPTKIISILLNLSTCNVVPVSTLFQLKFQISYCPFYWSMNVSTNSTDVNWIQAHISVQFAFRNEFPFIYFPITQYFYRISFPNWLLNWHNCNNYSNIYFSLSNIYLSILTKCGRQIFYSNLSDPNVFHCITSTCASGSADLIKFACLSYGISIQNYFQFIH